MNYKKWLFTSLLILSIALTACGNRTESGVEDKGETEKPDEKEVLQLFTTIFPLEDFAKRIGGEYVNVTNLVPVGADAHTFEPTAREMIGVAEGDAFIYNGAGLEGFVDALLETVAGEDVAIVEASKGIEMIDSSDSQEEEDADAHEKDHADGEDGAHAHEEEAHSGEGEADEHGHHHDEDPHIWLDPILSITLAESIKDTLVELMPEQEDTFVANFETLKLDLEAIDAEFQTMVDEAAHDTILVSHAGYGYWEARYGVKQIGIAGLSPTNEPSQRQLQSVIELAKELHINYVMFERNISPKVSDVVKKTIGAEGLYLHNLESLIEDDVKNGEDYSSLMRKNIEALRTALNE